MFHQTLSKLPSFTFHHARLAMDDLTTVLGSLSLGNTRANGMTERQMVKLAMQLSLDDNENVPPNVRRNRSAASTPKVVTDNGKAPIARASKPKSNRGKPKPKTNAPYLLTTHASGRPSLVRWASCVVDPVESRLRLHRRARTLSDAAVDAAEAAANAPRAKRSTRQSAQSGAPPTTKSKPVKVKAVSIELNEDKIQAKPIVKKSTARKPAAEDGGGETAASSRPKRSTKQVERFEAIPSTMDSKQIRQASKGPAQLDEPMEDAEPIAMKAIAMKPKPSSKANNKATKMGKSAKFPVAETSDAAKAEFAKSKAKAKRAAERLQVDGMDDADGPIILTDIPDSDMRQLRAGRVSSSGRAGAVPFEVAVAVGVASKEPQTQVFAPGFHDISERCREENGHDSACESDLDDNSEEEDDSDEAYARRHYWREEEEQQLARGKLEQRHWIQCEDCAKWRKGAVREGKKKHGANKAAPIVLSFFCGGGDVPDAACNALCSWLVEGVGLEVTTAFAKAGLHNLDQLREDKAATDGSSGGGGSGGLLKNCKGALMLAREDALTVVEGAGFSYDPISEQISPQPLAQ
jgi:hypothetical protein